MKNVNLIVGMVGGILTMIWTTGVFVGGVFAGVALMKSSNKDQNLKVVK
jgi:hypothetical protein